MSIHAAAIDSAPARSVPQALTPEWLCETYLDRVYRFASMVARGEVEAEDIAHDALERAIRAARTFDPGRGTVEAWLWRIVVRAAADGGRATLRRQRIVSRLIERRLPDEDIEQSIEDSVSDATLLASVRALPARDRTLIALRFGSDLSFAEVGALSGMSEAAAAVAVRRALAKLRKNLEGIRP